MSFQKPWILNPPSIPTRLHGYFVGRVGFEPTNNSLHFKCSGYTSSPTVPYQNLRKVQDSNLQATNDRRLAIFPFTVKCNLPFWEVMESNHLPTRGKDLQSSAGPPSLICTSLKHPVFHKSRFLQHKHFC